MKTTIGFNDIIKGEDTVVITEENRAVIMAARGSADRCCQVLSPSKFVWKEGFNLVGITLDADTVKIHRSIPKDKLLASMRKVALARRAEV